MPYRHGWWKVYGQIKFHRHFKIERKPGSGQSYDNGTDMTGKYQGVKVWNFQLNKNAKFLLLLHYF